MINAIEELEGFSNRELAYFMKYRLKYLEDPLKIKLKSYIHSNRGINNILAQQLTTTKIKTSESVHCSRCGSSKVVIKNNNKNCFVCGKVKGVNLLINIIKKILDTIPI